MKHIKLIWDFRGPDAFKTAAHHEIHLIEYAKLNNNTSPITGHQQLTDHHSIAYYVVTEQEMITTRDALKPHRGTLYHAKNN